MERHKNNLIRRGQSSATAAREAVREFHAAVVQPDMALVLFFCSSAYDLAALADEMAHLFAGVQVVGCTTAGEIGLAGYLEHSLTGASFPASSFNAVSGYLGHLQQFKVATGQALVQDLLTKLENQVPQAEPGNCFALLLTDGLSQREESLTRTLQSALGQRPLVGGSAGDGVDFGRTHVYFDGCFHADSAVLVVVATPLPFKLFMTQHFVATDERLVVTEADCAQRIVKEINGLPAAREFARILGIDVRDLDSARFAASPVVVLINGTSYVRSIQKVNPDGGLTFFCAIENGLVLRVAKGVGLVQNLEQAYAQIRADIGSPQLVLCCECFLRKLEIDQNQLGAQVSDVFRHNNTIGFNTYGEQFRGVHVNQTLVGVAIGTDASEADDD